MSDESTDYEPEERPRDEKIDEVKHAIMEQVFRVYRERVFYSVQIETLLERQYFHWITNKGLAELASEAVLARYEQFIQPTNQLVYFYTHPKYRYWKREGRELSAFLSRLYDPNFTHAIGAHCEMMFDSALARIGFMPVARNVNAWQGKQWPDSRHNLDKVALCDGIPYGIEIKNTQNYISRDELETKVRLSKYLGLTPLFIMRFAPKSYIELVRRAGGFCLLFEEQIYPFGYRLLMEEVRSTLGLKVQCPRDIPEGHLLRLKNWHDKRKAAR